MPIRGVLLETILRLNQQHSALLGPQAKASVELPDAAWQRKQVRDPSTRPHSSARAQSHSALLRKTAAIMFGIGMARRGKLFTVRLRTFFRRKLTLGYDISLLT